MNLQQRKELLERLGLYMEAKTQEWESIKQKAYTLNQWFIPEFIDLAVRNISEQFLKPQTLQELITTYGLKNYYPEKKKVGLVMAGNIPLVGFHDFLCVFLSGHTAVIKLSSKDDVLLRHLVEKLVQWNEEAGHHVMISDMVNDCDAYIATGSNNSSRYFEFYFRRYPHIIRKNRTSVAILSGKESDADLEKLADDVYLFFGLGCRNVTKIYVPAGYDFEPLLNVFRKYNYLADHNKYRNNYDYNLALLILNKQYYMTNGSIILVEENNPFSRISQLNYEFYTDEKAVKESLADNEMIQCVLKDDGLPFGNAQTPGICNFADGVDTMKFLTAL